MKILKKTIIIIVALAALLTVSTYLFMEQKTFGTLPKGDRLEKIKKSPNYKEGAFQNLTETEVLLKDASYLKMMRRFFTPSKKVAPQGDVPSVKTDLKNINDDHPTLIWFGHSSYLIKSKGM